MSDFLNLRSGDKELLGVREERLRDFAGDVSSPSGFIFERIEDSKRRRSDLECEPCGCARFSFHERKCGLQKAFYLSFLAWASLQRYQQPSLIHFISPTVGQIKPSWLY